MDPQSQYLGCGGCAGMSGLGGQGRWLVDAHQCLTSFWKQSTAWTQKLEAKTALVTYYCLSVLVCNEIITEESERHTTP